MATYSDAEIQQLMVELESGLVERKESAADRVEIASPGGLYGRMTRENFGKGDTDYRNPLLAEIMHHLGFAQRFGLGGHDLWARTLDNRPCHGDSLSELYRHFFLAAVCDLGQVLGHE